MCHIRHQVAAAASLSPAAVSSAAYARFAKDYPHIRMYTASINTSTNVGLVSIGHAAVEGLHSSEHVAHSCEPGHVSAGYIAVEGTGAIEHMLAKTSRSTITSGSRSSKRKTARGPGP